MRRTVLIQLLLPGLILSGPATLPAGAETPSHTTAPRTLTVTPGMVTWDPVTNRLTLHPDALPVAHPPAPGTPPLPVIDPADTSPEAALLRRLVARGQAAGLNGVIYDNRDRGHSPLPPGLFPQLTRLAYAPELRASGADYGLAGRLRLPAITFGNSSTAVTAGALWRSLPRLAMTTPGDPGLAWAGYTANALYLYPEHHDHDAVDLYPAAWPYMLVSQGSSYSDQPFLRAVGLILAAFRPDTRARLQALGLVAPTVQMVFRRAQTGVRSRADYLSGAAHPSAFAAAAINPVAMIALANSLTPGDIPPVVRLDVLQEDFTFSAGLAGRSEHLFDTPSAIARLWRGLGARHRMTVSAAATTDPNGRALRFDWVLLRGDSARVTITPLDAAGSRARITFGWQDPRPAPRPFTAGRSAPVPQSDRVDIGVFADNGVQPSAPAFISVSFPAGQIRRYEPGPDGTPRLAEIDYDAEARTAAQGDTALAGRQDPLLWWSAPWHDTFHYDATGKLTGWTRRATRPTIAASRAVGDYDARGRLGGKTGQVPRYVIADPDRPVLSIVSRP